MCSGLYAEGKTPVFETESLVAQAVSTQRKLPRLRFIFHHVFAIHISETSSLLCSPLSIYYTKYLLCLTTTIFSPSLLFSVMQFMSSSYLQIYLCCLFRNVERFKAFPFHINIILFTFLTTDKQRYFIL
jgi:hypothetical protein